MAKNAAVREVRAWAKTNGFDIGDRGRLPTEVWDAWAAAAPKAGKRIDRPAASAAAARPSVEQAELRQAQERISDLEARLDELTTRLEAVERTAASAPPAAVKRRFARSR